jgi:hypothetical protein
VGCGRRRLFPVSRHCSRHWLEWLRNTAEGYIRINCLCAKNSTLKSKHVHRFTRIRLYKTVIRPVLMYGSETWVMTKKIENIINSYERKILRRILWPINDNGTWRIRYNKEIYTLYWDPELSTVITLRLQWAGHVQRMESQSIPRMAMAGQMFGKRPVGNPKKRWMDAVKEDSYQILNWRN